MFANNSALRHLPGHWRKPVRTVYNTATTTTHDFDRLTKHVRVLVIGSGAGGRVYTSSDYWIISRGCPGNSSLVFFNMDDANVAGDTQANLVVGAGGAVGVDGNSSTFNLGTISVVASGGQYLPYQGLTTSPSGGSFNTRGGRGESFLRLDGYSPSGSQSQNWSTQDGAPFWGGREGGHGQCKGKNSTGSAGYDGMILIEEYR